VGRQSVREALRLLEISGFITIQKGVNGGPVIQNTMLNKMAGMFLDTYKFNRIPIKDLTVARVEIGKQVLRLVIDNATETNIRDLLKNVRKAKKNQNKNLPAFEENINFHRLLAKASKNHVFVLVMESLMAVESDFRSRFQNIDIAKSIKITKLHEEILEAIINGDYHLAQRVLETLIHMVHKMYRSNFSS
jgi:DNA-binding FadR family transcriptional regulator